MLSFPRILRSREGKQPTCLVQAAALSGLQRTSQKSHYLYPHHKQVYVQEEEKQLLEHPMKQAESKRLSEEGHSNKRVDRKIPKNNLT